MTPTEFAVKTLYWFFLYGFIGWGVEVVYAAIKERRLVNRGFLCGPICPIYGCGMVVLNWTVAALAPSGEGKSVSTVAVTPLVFAPIRSSPIRSVTARVAARPPGESARSVTAATGWPAPVRAATSS